VARSLDRTGTVATAAADAIPAAAMTAVRFVLMLFLREMAALVLIGAVILLAAAAWQYLTGGRP
jgi:hypothetical protein